MADSPQTSSDSFRIAQAPPLVFASPLNENPWPKHPVPTRTRRVDMISIRLLQTQPRDDYDGNRWTADSIQRNSPLSRRSPTTIIMEIVGRQTHLRFPQTPSDSPRPPHWSSPLDENPCTKQPIPTRTRREDAISIRLLQTQPHNECNGNRWTADSSQSPSDSLRLSQAPSLVFTFE